MSTAPSKNVHEVLASFGSASFLMKQSIVPVVAWIEGGMSMTCVGTATVISCTGYVLTAAHVLMDPVESGYGGSRSGGGVQLDDNLEFGVFMPVSPAYGGKRFRIFPIEKFWVWGRWRDTPLFHEPDRFDYSTDIAICKIPEMQYGAAHQPFSMSVNPFAVGETAYSVGYAKMPDIPIEYLDGELRLPQFDWDLFVSIGSVKAVYDQNHVCREVPTPGPCFNFDASIPGKMSGGPIFGANGSIVRGVVSTSGSDEGYAHGAMLGPSLDLPMDEPGIEGRTLRTMMDSGKEGMAKVLGVGL